jgi:subtilase family serine protease
MRRTRTASGVALVAATLTLSTSSFALASIPSAGAHPSRYVHGRTVPAGYGTRAVCPQPASRTVARCLAIGVTASPGSKQIVTTAIPVSGITPADIQDAYKLPATGGNGRTVAVVEAGNYPNLESDLATYRDFFGLPPCTKDSGCLTVANEHGGSTLPHRRDGWSIETALDVDSVSAACPTCHILVIEAKDAHRRHLGIGNATAARMGAVASSNSWKIPEFEGMDQGRFARYFSAPGVAFTASSGDGGHTPLVTIGYPSGLPTVLSIGGTLLRKDDSHRGWTESAWAGAGSGCGVYVPKPSWQRDKGCTMRATSDVSADASPASGLAVYHTVPGGQGGWSVYGGTSLSAPLIAAMYGLAGNTGDLGRGIAKHLYANSKHLYDVTTGSNGTCPPEWPYICQAGEGYDGPTGLGTPHGLGAL